jgi:hypothetical protein
MKSSGSKMTWVMETGTMPVSAFAPAVPECRLRRQCKR